MTKRKAYLNTEHDSEYDDLLEMAPETYTGMISYEGNDIKVEYELKYFYLPQHFQAVFDKSTLSVDYLLARGFGPRFRKKFVVRSNTDNEKELKKLLQITRKNGVFDKFPHNETPIEDEESNVEMETIEEICKYPDILFYSEPTEDRQETWFIEKYGITNVDDISKMRKQMKKENKERKRALQESLESTGFPKVLEGVIGSFVEE